MSGSLQGQRVVVVGASAGIGRAAALRAASEGARVVVAARRGEALDALCRQAGGSAHFSAVTTDVSSGSDCRRLAEHARATLGGIDLLIYSVGYSPLRRLRDTGADEWFRVFTANVVGASQVIQAVLPVMTPAGIIAALSSETVGNPRIGLGAYASSKAALEEMMRTWRLEEPQIRFCTVSVGATLPTEFGDNYDAEILVPTLLEWARCGSIQEYSMRTGMVANALVGALAAALPCPEVSMEILRLRSPAPAIAPTTDLDTVLTYASTTPEGGRVGVIGAWEADAETAQ